MGNSSEYSGCKGASSTHACSFGNNGGECFSKSSNCLDSISSVCVSLSTTCIFFANEYSEVFKDSSESPTSNERTKEYNFPDSEAFLAFHQIKNLNCLLFAKDLLKLISLTVKCFCSL